MNNVHVKLTQGTVIGTEETLLNGDPFYIFSGIPYAKPPIGNLRFKVSYTFVSKKNFVHYTILIVCLTMV